MFPSVNYDRAAQALDRWLAKGYAARIWADPDDTRFSKLVGQHSHVVFAGYPGYFSACAVLAEMEMQRLYGAYVVVLAGDDMHPDPNRTASEIAGECADRYGGYTAPWVMQPTGDDLRGTDKICGSPWLSLGWVARAYLGRFSVPVWYRQFYGDEELLEVAKRLGVLHQRPDLTQRHDHWSRKDVKIPRLPYQEANTKRWWDVDAKTFAERKAAGFPGSDLWSLTP